MKKIYSKIKQIIKGKLHEYRIDDNSKILIISPHPDDESIGMGGFLIKYNRNCEVILVTNGAWGNPEWSKEKTIEVRKQEFLDALSYMGVEKLHLLGVMDQEVKNNLDKLKQYLVNDYDYVFVPNRNDIHPDHSCIYKFVKRFIKRKNLKSIIAEYEVWTPLSRPNFFLDISDCYEKKGEAIQKYVSQTKHVKYDWGSLGLNMYRGMLSGNLYAEAYHINKAVLDRIVDKFRYIKNENEKARKRR